MIDNPSADADFGVAADESGELNDGSAFLATLNTALTWSKVWCKLILPLARML